MKQIEKLTKLRDKMQEEKLDVYYVPTSDPHLSEYIAPAFKTRAWLSGFTGSAGALLVFPDQAKLWTDGRYFIQAAQEIAGSGFDLMKQATPGYPSLVEYLQDQVPEGGRVGVNGRMLAQSEAESLQARLRTKNASLELGYTLVEDLWEDRPELPFSEAFLLGTEYTGLSTADKLTGLRDQLKADGTDAALLGKLDDIAWLFNLRARDIANTPVALAYAFVTLREAILFIDLRKIRPEIEAELKGQGVSLLDYTELEDFLARQEQTSIRLDKTQINSAVFAAIPDTCPIIDGHNWTTWQKAVKNPVEIANQREAYRKDGIAVTKLIYWLKHQTDLTQVTEFEVSERLYGYRENLSHFVEQSFTTIAAYDANAAMMHYAPTEEHTASLAPKSFLLVDSGGQYFEGTTDTTRTIALGELTPIQKRDYTLTLKSHIALASAVFLHGTTGYYLDAIARQPLWKYHMDYKCGTGHGVGYMLGVHEGPHSISSRYIPTMLVPGMIVTDEPGVYKENEYGIRLENVYVVEEDAYVEPDRFYRFSNLTQVPFEREAIDVNLLSPEEIAWVDAYHAEVLQQLSADLTQEESAWLQEVCKPLASEN